MTINDACRCGKQKQKSWHLLCPSCWGRVPQLLRDECYYEYKKAQGSEVHRKVIREIFEFLGPRGAQ